MYTLQSVRAYFYLSYPFLGEFHCVRLVVYPPALQYFPLTSLQLQPPATSQVIIFFSRSTPVSAWRTQWMFVSFAALLFNRKLKVCWTPVHFCSPIVGQRRERIIESRKRETPPFLCSFCPQNLVHFYLSFSIIKKFLSLMTSVYYWHSQLLHAGAW